MKKRMFGSVAALALTVQAFVGGMASADPGAATHVDSVSATAGSSSVAVSGGATFVDIPALVGEDATGDVDAAGFGMDMSTVRLSRAPGSNTIKFTLGIADQPPTLFGTPEVLMYQWDLAVGASGTQTPRLYKVAAGRTAQAQSVGANPWFKRYTCSINPSTGVNDCVNGQVLTGKIADGVVEWNVSLSNIGATAGERITASGEGISVVPTASGVFWGLVAFDQAAQDQEFEIPGATVSVGIAPAGTPEGSVSLSQVSPSNVNVTTGAFSGTVAKPAQSGSYIVVAKACYGSTNCGIKSTTLTV